MYKENEEINYKGYLVYLDSNKLNTEKYSYEEYRVDMLKAKEKLKGMLQECVNDRTTT